MTQPEQALSAETAALARAIAENAARLGLTWRLLPATVVSKADAGEAVLVRLDGDDANIDAVRSISLCGVVMPGERVMVMFVPPQGIYVLSRYATERRLPSCSIPAVPMNVANASFTPLAWATPDPSNPYIEWDNASYFIDNGNANLRLPYTGFYDMWCKFNWDTGVPAASGAILVILTAAAIVIGEEELAAAPGGHATVHTVANTFYAEAGLLVGGSVYQATGGPSRDMTARMRLTYRGIRS